MSERMPTRAELGLPETGFRILRLQQQLQDHCRRSSTSGCGCCSKSRAACCGCRGPMRTGREQSAARGRGARRRSRRDLCFAPFVKETSRITWRAIAWPICSWIRCRSTPTPPPAMRSGPACRCSPALARRSSARVAASLLERGGIAGIDHELHGGVRGARFASGDRRSIAGRHQSKARAIIATAIRCSTAGASRAMSRWPSRRCGSGRNAASRPQASPSSLSIRA